MLPVFDQCVRAVRTRDCPMVNRTPGVSVAAKVREKFWGGGVVGIGCRRRRRRRGEGERIGQRPCSIIKIQRKILGIFRLVAHRQCRS